MILFFSETNYKISKKKPLKKWLTEIASMECKKIGEVSVVFHNDAQLLVLNNRFLNHNILTDIITFDYSEKNIINGDICISVERVKENALKFNCSFMEELRRVMVHGILHLCGFEDKKNDERLLMRQKENSALELFNTKYNYK